MDLSKWGTMKSSLLLSMSGFRHQRKGLPSVTLQTTLLTSAPAGSAATGKRKQQQGNYGEVRTKNSLPWGQLYHLKYTCIILPLTQFLLISLKAVPQTALVFPQPGTVPGIQMKHNKWKYGHLPLEQKFSTNGHIYILITWKA